MNFELFLNLEENFENLYSPSSDHIKTFTYKQKKTIPCDLSVSCDVIFQAVEAVT